jgi:hypothetical protein
MSSTNEYFARLRENESNFYQRMWQELSEMKVIDTHEHISPYSAWNGQKEKLPYDSEKQPLGRIPEIFPHSYVHFSNKGSYKEWAQELLQHRGTAYLKSWLWAMEELYGLEAQPITPKYLEQMESILNEAYQSDVQNNQYSHMREILESKMHVEALIDNIDLGRHCELPQPICRGAAGIPLILNGIQVPNAVKGMNKNVNSVYYFAETVLKMDVKEEIKTLDDYCAITEKFLNHLKTSGKFICIKMQNAYERPLWFPEPPEDSSEIAKLFNKPYDDEQKLWLFGNYMMHFIMEWAAVHWNVPIQLHTGLARMYDGGSNALNLSHLFQKFPDLHFDLFHGNYPYNNLAGMLHQIGNISADLCWLPAISPTAAQRTLTELFEVGDMAGTWPDHIPSMRTSLFGGDSSLVEGSYGALLQAKDVLIRTLDDLHNRGLMFEKDAIDLAERVLYSNPKRIFRL